MAMREVLTASTILTGAATVTDGAVAVDDRHVAWVGPAAGLPPDWADAPRTDYPGATITPGLIDTHVHLGFDGGPAPVARMQAETDAQQLVLMLHSARELLGAGVTTARDLGARSFLDVVVRDAIAADLARGPRLLVANRPITVTGGHCWFMGGEADTVDDVRRMVRVHHKHGADVIKVMATGGVMTTGSKPSAAQFSDEQLRAVVEEADRLGKRVAAHAHGVQGIRRAVAAGVTTIEHCTFLADTMLPEFDPELASLIAERGIFVCPTINASAPTVLDRLGFVAGGHLREMHRLGVRLVAGTDAGIDNNPHHAYVGGLEYLQQLGFTPQQVLSMATTEAAEAIGVDGITGRIAAGYEADLLVVADDPTADIGALRSLLRVVARGRDYVPDSGRFGHQP